MAARPDQFVESLESRCLLSAVVHGRTLDIVGTHKADVITILTSEYSGDSVTVVDNGVTHRFLLKNVDTISVLAGEGNDYIFVDNQNSRLDKNLIIDGSGGKDTLIGGFGRDHIYGGPGNDSIRGANTRDILYGGSGNDTIDGGQGNDYIDGGSGNDSLIGGPGIDELFGTAGNDTLDGSDGSADKLNGGSGTDTAIYDLDFDGLISIERPFGS